MKLVRFGPKGIERPGLVDSEGTLRSLEGVVDDIDPSVVTPEGLVKLAALDISSLPVVAPDTRTGCPLTRIGKIVAIGLNYQKHAEEASVPLPDEPIIFLKVPSSTAGPDDDLVIPAFCKEVDWEVELALVIGKTAKAIAKDEVRDSIAGYMICNDISERHFQHHRGGTWDKGKNFDGFCPLGPWLVTADEVANPQALSLRLELNGHVMQSSNTADMIFDLETIVSYVSRLMTLHPGDVIITGTPEGVGLGMKPPRYLVPGDVMTVSIEGLGRQVQKCV